MAEMTGESVDGVLPCVRDGRQGDQAMLTSVKTIQEGATGGLERQRWAVCCPAHTTIEAVTWIKPYEWAREGHPGVEGNYGLGCFVQQDEKKNERIWVLADDDDPLNPPNWSILSRTKNIAMSLLIFTQAWAGAAESVANSDASQEFGISRVAENLSTAMYLFNIISSSSLFVGPISETVGRNPPYLGVTWCGWHCWDGAGGEKKTHQIEVIVEGEWNAPILEIVRLKNGLETQEFPLTAREGGSTVTRPAPLKWTNLWDWVILVGLDGSLKWD
ncbi:hypothetical protein B0H14DRAFT_3135376 [Mycena olivaceomarginata]|nr:hypothetical protein B0H14DRAFT_3135376 [Mycena olivaceomarginata]